MKGHGAVFLMPEATQINRQRYKHKLNGLNTSVPDRSTFTVAFWSVTTAEEKQETKAPSPHPLRFLLELSPPELG